MLPVHLPVLWKGQKPAGAVLHAIPAGEELHRHHRQPVPAHQGLDDRGVPVRGVQQEGRRAKEVLAGRHAERAYCPSPENSVLLRHLLERQGELEV